MKRNSVLAGNGNTINCLYTRLKLPQFNAVLDSTEAKFKCFMMFCIKN